MHLRSTGLGFLLIWAHVELWTETSLQAFCLCVSYRSHVAIWDFWAIHSDPHYEYPTSPSAWVYYPRVSNTHSLSLHQRDSRIFIPMATMSQTTCSLSFCVFESPGKKRAHMNTITFFFTTHTLWGLHEVDARAQHKNTNTRAEQQHSQRRGF